MKIIFKISQVYINHFFNTNNYTYIIIVYTDKTNPNLQNFQNINKILLQDNKLCISNKSYVCRKTPL